MRLSIPNQVFLSLLLVGCCRSETSISSSTPPNIQARTLINGEINYIRSANNLKDVYGCCTLSDETCPDKKSSSSADGNDDELHLQRVKIGSMPQFSKAEALAALAAARKAWDGGMGTWPQMSIAERVARIRQFVAALRESRSEIITTLQWEIGKTTTDATAEFDRTVAFIEQLIDALRGPDFAGDWQKVGSTVALTRRAAVGIVMCLGPFNYPLNETYATLIPALLMGNVVVMKIPTVGGLSHLLTMEAFSKSLPAGAINLISGSGRETMPPLMSTGSIDGLAFIGGSKAADDLIKEHPHPHRLKLFLQLEAKNMGIFLHDVFSSSRALEHAISQTITGSLSYNGQRCTALKLIFVPRQHAPTFLEHFIPSVERLKVGLPWDEPNPTVTPLPNAGRVAYMKQLIADATAKGAKIVNKRGGEIVGGEDSTLMIPAVLYPVTKDMNVYHEEQFGPVVPIVPYDSLKEVVRYAKDGQYGQQASIFTVEGGDSSEASSLIDKFSSIFGKLNINSQCGRSPDTLPFSGRRSSAMGVMSVVDALREFSVPTVVAYKGDGGVSAELVERIENESSFMKSVS